MSDEEIRMTLEEGSPILGDSRFRSLKQAIADLQARVAALERVADPHRRGILDVRPWRS